MSIDGPRFAAFLAYTERGCSPEDAGACVMALHPLDDAPVPGRAFEKAVRSRSRTFARDAKKALPTVAVGLAHEALSDYRTLAVQFGEHYYQTRYNQYLPEQSSQAGLAAGPVPTSAPVSHELSMPAPSTAWWGAPTEPAPPPPPTGQTPRASAPGVNASWGFEAPERPRPSGGAASPDPHSAMPPPIAEQRVVRSSAVSGAAAARTFSGAVSGCLSKYAVFSGRASRSEYWYFGLFTFLAVFAASLLSYALLPPSLANVVATLTQLALLLPGMAVGVRRMHDVDRSGWFILVPLYNFVLLVSPGTDGPNRFG